MRLMGIESALAPVQAEMPLVREKLREIAEVDFPQLAEMLSYLMDRMGKGIRPALTLLSGKFKNYNLDSLIPMATAVELLHTATLVHDDAIDKSLLRHGFPTLNSIWGDSAATVVGDYLFAKSAEVVTIPGNVRVVRLFAQTLMAIAKGELDEALSAYNLQQTRQDYFRRIANKTASLFAMATESGAILSENSEEVVQALKNYGYNLGLAFQIADDILDFTGEEKEMGKPVGKDLRQGILTLPAILMLERSPGDNPVKRGFENRGEDLNRAVAEIRNSSLIEESYIIATELARKACQAIENLPDSPPKRALIELAEYAAKRKK